MASTLPNRRRVKIGATVDPTLLRVVDDYVERHPGCDRSAIIDEALALWHAREQERAMRAQFEAPDDVPPEEQRTWRKVRRAAAERRFCRPGAAADA
ncbi:MAG: hypothetical protein AVDCRST_MAG77-3279 [uncultured Chloroflexi bacterium]|uniref:Ribbon-helix-helix protein CopG domain-containing protein n=1 Tax=uncultured Chloroflexota bacterium TaxID=166587 RepID=A0A6J4J842_9CHLR|nr:MAG: hypothetical protein AVDCRST_MAG77-3279 [uncultured Chloroflexota bacterium]